MNSTKTRLGATPEEWSFFADICESDLLPIVCNQKARISKNSSLKGVGKMPSVYNRAGEVVGIKAWPDHIATAPQIKAWKAQEDYGLCIIAREYRGVDVDVDDPDLANMYGRMIRSVIGVAPVRYREGSGRFLVMVRVVGDIPKEVLKVEGGAIEFLGTGQQFVACGTHKSGERLKWRWCDVPTISLEKYRELVETLAMVAESRSTSQLPGERGADVHKDDPVATWLEEQGLVLGETDRGLLVACPWAHEHSDPEDDEAMWLPAGRGGHAVGHFNCYHTACDGVRNRNHYLEAVGYQEDVSADMPDLEPLEATNDQIVAEMNKTMAFVSGPGTSRSACVLVFGEHGWRLEDLTMTARRLHNEPPVRIEKKTMKRFDYWMQHADRRTYPNGLRFLPGEPREVNGAFNTWGGWGVKPADVPWPRIRRHIFEVLASGDQVIYDYIMDWLAWRVQYPAGTIRTALAFSSREEGAGKGTLGVWLREIFGPSMVVAHKAEHITGKFNIQLRDANLVLAEEAFFAGDHRNVGPLKGLITDQRMMVEQKGVTPYQVDNHVALLMFTNESWVARVGTHDRRFAIFGVQKAKGDYYQKLYEGKDRDIAAPDELPGFMYELQKKRDVTLWNPESYPRTELHAEQVLQSLVGMEAFMLEYLEQDELPESVTKSAFKDMIHAWRDKNDRYRKITEREIKRVVEACAGWTGRDHDGPMLWRFPKQDVARDAFAQRILNLEAWRVE